MPCASAARCLCGDVTAAASADHEHWAVAACRRHCGLLHGHPGLLTGHKQLDVRAWWKAADVQTQRWCAGIGWMMQWR